MVEIYKDDNGCMVSFSSEKAAFSASPAHVLVLVHSDIGWVFTRHKERGLEFPGGKKEKDETIEQAAIRETFEETGAVIDRMVYLGQYKVDCHESSFVKNVYLAFAERIAGKADYLETEGPVILKELPDDFSDPSYSYIMRDRTVLLCMKRIKELNLLQ